jgi:adenylate cyclase
MNEVMETTIAILMADLSGFTAMTEVHGSEMAAQMIDKYVSLVKSSLKGQSVMLERVGDQVVVISPDPDDLAETALALIESSGREKNFLSIHAGLHYGNVLELAGNYYGSTINLTARIAAKARQGKVLCSKNFIDALSQTGRFRYIYHGKFNFRNVLEAKEIIELLPVEAINIDEKYICPVCHMQLDQNEISYEYIHDGEAYYFCSEECKALFRKYQIYNTGMTA